MVLKTINLSIFLCTSLLLFADEVLFFTDNYETNLYKSDEAVITFNNNLFLLTNNQEKGQIDSLFNAYFEEINVTATKIKSQNKYQTSYSYKAINENYLTWSKLWHNDYELKLNKLLQQYMQRYISADTDTTASAIAYAKLLYYYSIKHSSSLSAFGRTRIHVQIPNINILSFTQNNISPNQTWNRIITNSKLSSFNEAYYVNNKTMNYLFLGPNSKSRLADCVSMHLFDMISNKNASPTYLSNYTYFLTNEKESLQFDSTEIKKLIPQVFKHIELLINSPDYSFYTIEDLLSLQRVKESYSTKSFYEFIKLFIYTNNYNALIDKNSESPVYSYMTIKDTIYYKTNVEFLKSTKDSVLLDQIATFLLNNSFREFQLFGNASKDEYLKIEKAKYKSLVKKYNTYSPLKMSKKVDLSLYRALVIFDYLYKKGVSPYKMFCLGKKHIPVENKRFAKTYFILKY